jgi:hypothetical protein
MAALPRDVWRVRAYAVWDAVIAEAAVRLRARLGVAPVEPMPSRSPRGAWHWPAALARVQTGATYRSLGARYGRSYERVRQAVAIELRAWAWRDEPDLAAWLDAVETSRPWPR